jgi:medium-chain acyl-[acyl-carrier-protein] hydrolase
MKSIKIASSSPWLVPLKPAEKCRLRLYCFSYAGGGARVYSSWSSRFPLEVEMWGVELPGRGARFRETPWTSIQTYAHAIASELMGLDDTPFAFFGHSMGAFLSFEVARQMEQQGFTMPVHVYVSGAGAPHLQPLSEPIYALPDIEFAERIREFDGCPPELFVEPELLELVLPILRADFCACDTYVYHDGDPLRTAITAFGGLDDPETTLDRLVAWRQHSTGQFSVHRLEGGHFFLQSSEAEFLALFNRELRALI